MATQVSLLSGAVASAGTLKLQSNGTTDAITIGTDQSVTTANTINGLTVGKGAGSVSTNTAVGASALAGSNSGTYNTALGYQSMYVNTTGAYGTALGGQALKSNTTGQENTAVGLGALEMNTTGSYNVAQGLYALRLNTTASEGVAIGYQAGYTNTTSNKNTFVGAKAGYTSNATGTTSAANTCVGHETGYSLTTGAGNCFVGPGNGSVSNAAGYAMTTGSLNTILGGFTGNQGGLDIRTASNYIVLSDGAGNPRFYLNNTGKLYAPNMGSGAGTYTVKYNISTFELSADTSSAKYKDNIRDSKYGLSDIAKLKSRMFEYKDSGETDIGLIAEEVNEVIPELTFTGRDGTIDGVKYDRFVSVCIKAIQELKAEFDAYKEAHP